MGDGRTADDRYALSGLADGVRQSKSTSWCDPPFGSRIAIDESPVSGGIANRWCRAQQGKKGDCFDNAVVESFFSTLKRELLLNHVFHTRKEGRSQVFEDLEVFDNRQRRHSTLGDKTPVEFEQLSIHAVA
ncbi:IS3 family transposase [Deinococcus oregonensis]|uniref:IS3 family transposase n=1 Tax=Deinococcus oregonensis TaxID=1805970 RepID=A0ABV6B2W2_9DEIO